VSNKEKTSVMMMMMMIVMNMMIMMCAAFVFAKPNVSERLRQAA
jgi:hypothetical protein